MPKLVIGQNENNGPFIFHVKSNKMRSITIVSTENKRCDTPRCDTPNGGCINSFICNLEDECQRPIMSELKADVEKIIKDAADGNFNEKPIMKSLVPKCKRKV
jgi:hypothetical protein